MRLRGLRQSREEQKGVSTVGVESTLLVERKEENGGDHRLLILSNPSFLPSPFEDVAPALSVSQTLASILDKTPDPGKRVAKGTTVSSWSRAPRISSSRTRTPSSNHT